jgi:hypothetical protein
MIAMRAAARQLPVYNLNLSRQVEPTRKGLAMNQEFCCCLEPASIQRQSVNTAWRKEADSFKWLESEKAGRDLGEPALRLWVKKHWWGFLRARWVEHLQGSCFWIELDRNDFGLILREFPEQQTLLNEIIAHLVANKENLDIIRWAEQTDRPMSAVCHILERLDINGHRLEHEYQRQDS